MPPIRKLSEDLIRHIAAGEVVERPASVLKELLENALDAGARRVVVEWEEAGRRSIRVTDDGCGMDPEEAVLALERHATSKVSSLEDLQRIGTYGFRGEALPSLAAVSRFQLVTRPADAPQGWKIECEGGRRLRKGPAGAPAGTTVLVEDLFFAVPARLKFLKSDATERGLLLRTVEDLALAAPRVDFRLVSEKKEVLSLPAARPDVPPEEALRERLRGLWGADRTGSLRPVRAEGRFLTVRGWVSDVHASQPTSRYQRLFVNNRPIVNRRLSFALYDAYKGRLPAGRHPLAAVFLDMDPAHVDANVHPAKREVRFSQEEEVLGFVSRALQSALSEGAAMPAAAPAPFSYPAPGGGAPSLAESRAAYALQSPAFPPPSPAAASASGRAALPAETAALPGLSREDFSKARFEVLMQVDLTYILARDGDRVYIFDQHAAAERVLYERFTEAARNRSPHRQNLLLPWIWEPAPEVAAVAAERLEDLERLGYRLEPFGPKTFRVSSVPGALGDTPRVRTLLEGLAEDLVSGSLGNRWEPLLVRAACRGAVKAGDALQPPEMGQVLAQLQKCESPWSCPHGRPTFLRLSPEELAGRFKRT